MREAQSHQTLLEALYAADFEEHPVKHDICEVLSKLQGSNPDRSSTVRPMLRSLEHICMCTQHCR